MGIKYNRKYKTPFGEEVVFFAIAFSVTMKMPNKVTRVSTYTPQYVITTDYANGRKIRSVKENKGKKFYETSRKYYLNKVKK